MEESYEEMVGAVSSGSRTINEVVFNTSYRILKQNQIGDKVWYDGEEKAYC